MQKNPPKQEQNPQIGHYRRLLKKSFIYKVRSAHIRKLSGEQTLSNVCVLQNLYLVGNLFDSLDKRFFTAAMLFIQ